MESRLSFQKYKNSAKFSRKFPAALWEPGNHGILNLNGVPAFSSRNRLNFITGVYDYEKPKIPALYQLGAYCIGCYCLQCFSGFSLMKVQTIFGVIGEIIQILMPIIYGGVLAYLMLPVYNSVYFFVCRNTKKLFTTEKVRSRAGKTAATLPVCCFCLYWSAAWLDDYPTDHGEHSRISGKPGRIYQ